LTFLILCLVDIQPFNNPNYIIAFVAFSNFAQNAPTKPFVAFLESDDLLQRMLTTRRHGGANAAEPR
jgi:hypothetical protein